MEEEKFKDFIKREAEEYPTKKLESDLEKINDSNQKIEKLQKKENSPYNTGAIKIEMRKILDVLPEDITVLVFEKDLYVSRAKAEDDVIQVWQRTDLNMYHKELDKLYTKKVLDIEEEL